MITRRRLLKGLGAFALGSVTLGGYAFGIEPMRTTVTRYRVRPASWPRGASLKIAVIADVHAGEPYMSAERVAGICAETNALAPDLIVLLGDYAASHRYLTRPVAPDAWAEAFSVLRAPLGVHAVLGNHDWWDDWTAQREGKGPIIGRRAIERRGIPVYENDVVRLQKDGQPFWLAGLGDQLALRIRSYSRIDEAVRIARGQPRSSMPPRFKGVDDLPATLARITDDAPVILLAHEPDIFPAVPGRVALTLSGHTHGGQIRLAGWAPIVPSRYGNRYAYGHVTERDERGREKHLVVSGGLGCSMLPVRLGCPPEIVIVEVG